MMGPCSDSSQLCSETTHIKNLKCNGFDICSPISGSMLPMIRPNRDSVLFIPKSGRAGAGDVVLYRSHGCNVMHRVIEVFPEGYSIRGDNCKDAEFISEEQVFGVMKGFYRDEKYIPNDSPVYRVYVKTWVGLNPVLEPMKKLRRGLLRVFR